MAQCVLIVAIDKFPYKKNKAKQTAKKSKFTVGQ